MSKKPPHKGRKTKEPVDQNGLTALQEQFCQAYLTRFSITYAEKELKLPKGKGSVLIQDDKVRQRINAIRLESGKAYDVTREKLLQELMAIVYHNPANLQGDDIVIWPEEEVKAVSGIEYHIDGSVKKVTKWDKLKAIEMLNKMLGYNMPDTSKSTVTIEPLSKEDVNEIAKKLKDALW